MKYIKSKLSRQLFSVIVVSFSIILISLGVILPKSMLPIYEKNLYFYLKQPLELVNEDIEDNPISQDIGYIYMYDGILSVSENVEDIIGIKNISKVLKFFNQKYGKFIYEGEIYYYYTNSNETDSIRRVAFTDNSYIIQAQEDSIHSVFPIVFITLTIVSFLLIFWSSFLVRRIEKLKGKIDHIDDNNFDHTVDTRNNDEIVSLELAVEDMRVSLKNQEEYRNQMYQNISHDFKTPLTVIKSYVEAVEDHVEDSEKAIQVIKEQTQKLEDKVHSLLYLNKLDYIKDMNLIHLEEIDIFPILDSSIQKFKYRNMDLSFKVVKVSNGKFYGTIDSWETVIDNLLNNFLRYAEKEIKITVKKDKIIFYNDGPNIDDGMIEAMFVPFRKGIKGEFGLGLSIVKKTLSYMGYDIISKNHNKKGVSFIISKGTTK